LQGCNVRNMNPEKSEGFGLLIPSVNIR